MIYELRLKEKTFLPLSNSLKYCSIKVVKILLYEISHIKKLVLILLGTLNEENHQAEMHIDAQGKKDIMSLELALKYHRKVATLENV